jgi:molybdopterin-guanine dinucleotide biosynthesis protein A
MFKESLKIPVVIFTGGRSSRLLVDNKRKWQLDFGRTNLLEYLISRLKTQSHQIVINCQSNDNSLLDEFDLPLINDFKEGSISNFQGPLAGLISALDWAKEEDYQWVATMPCDTPFFPNDFLEQLKTIQKTESASAVIASSNNRHHPVCGLWSVSLLDNLKSSVVDNNISAIGKWAKEFASIAEFSEENWNHRGIDPFFNINTIEDYHQAIRHLSVF